MAALKNISELIHAVARLVPGGAAAYIVGGTVRDILMKRDSADVDIAVSCDAGRLAIDIARELGGSAFVMDESRDVHRVALRAGPVAHVDVTPLRGSIDDDLAARDFTINAMAVPVTGGREGVIPAAGLVDPFSGLPDLEAETVRVVGPGSLTDDPLRLLRAFRLAAQLGFAIETGTLAQIRKLASMISNASPERVRDELYMILACRDSAVVLKDMLEHGLLFELFPELRSMEGMAQGGPHVHDTLTHSLRAVAHSEAVMAGTGLYFGEYAGAVDGYLDELADGATTIRAAVKLCALLHDTGKPGSLKVEEGRPRFTGHDETGSAINDAIARRFRMSDRVRDLLARTAALHMRPLGLSKGPVTGRAVHRIVRDAEGVLPALAVVALSDALATREAADETTGVEEIAARLVSYYYGEYRISRTEPLLRGGDIMTEFGLAQGPVIGMILEEVEEMRADGALKDRDGALEYVRGNIGKYRG